MFISQWEGQGAGSSSITMTSVGDGGGLTVRLGGQSNQDASAGLQYMASRDTAIPVYT